MTVTFGESTSSRTQLQLWYNRFKEDREDVNGSSTTDENIEAVKKMILDNRQITIREVLGMKFAAAKIVLKLQNFKQ